jgi:hypothetical protein
MTTPCATAFAFEADGRPPRTQPDPHFKHLRQVQRWLKLAAVAQILSVVAASGVVSQTWGSAVPPRMTSVWRGMM